MLQIYYTTTLLKYLPGELICENKEVKNSKDTVQSETEQMQLLEKTEELDVQTGLAYCMNEEEFYVEMLKAYLKEDKVSKIKQFYAEKDWNNYRTIVHALKSTSLTIGAVHLSEEAKALEMAAKEGDADYIQSHHKDVLEEYMGLLDRLKEIL